MHLETLATCWFILVFLIYIVLLLWKSHGLVGDGLTTALRDRTRRYMLCAKTMVAVVLVCQSLPSERLRLTCLQILSITMSGLYIKHVETGVHKNHLLVPLAMVASTCLQMAASVVVAITLCNLDIEWDEESRAQALRLVYPALLVLDIVAVAMSILWTVEVSASSL